MDDLEPISEQPYGVIYCITNLVNGKRYIGQTTTPPEDRWKSHCAPSTDSVIARAIRKYKKENFSFNVIDTAYSQQELNDRELYWSRFYHTWVGDPECNGYNVRECGGSHGTWPDEIKQKLSETMTGRYDGENNPFYGKTHTLETREKISEHHKEYYKDPEHRKPLSHPLTDEQKEKLSNSLKQYYQTHDSPMKGQHHSEETKEKLRNVPHKKGEDHPWFGRHHTDETKEKLSNTLTGMWAGEKNPMFGKHHTEEVRQLLSENAKSRMGGSGNPMYGHKHSDEAKAKMSASHHDYFGSKNPNAKRVQCDETGEIFECMKDAAKFAGVSITALSNYFSQGHHTCGGYHWTLIESEDT